jgi:hypothetical protein
MGGNEISDSFHRGTPRVNNNAKPGVLRIMFLSQGPRSYSAYRGIIQRLFLTSVNLLCEYVVVAVVVSVGLNVILPHYYRCES